MTTNATNLRLCDTKTMLKKTHQTILYKLYLCLIILEAKSGKSSYILQSLTALYFRNLILICFDI